MGDSLDRDVCSPSIAITLPTIIAFHSTSTATQPRCNYSVAGPSAALNVCGAVKLARKLGPGHTIVTVLCDGGDRYRWVQRRPNAMDQRSRRP